jgi:hypothetical protein
MPRAITICTYEHTADNKANIKNKTTENIQEHNKRRKQHISGGGKTAVATTFFLKKTTNHVK